MRDNWTYSDYTYVDSVYGDLLWNDAHIEYEASAQDTLLISIPYAKHDTLTGMLYFLNESGNYRYHHVDASDLLFLNSSDITSVEEHIYWELVASSFSRHQYYLIKQLDDPFHEKMLEIHSWPFAQPRCIYWSIDCSPIWGTIDGEMQLTGRIVCNVITRQGAGCSGPQYTVPTDPFNGGITPPGNNTGGGGGGGNTNDDNNGSTGSGTVNIDGDCVPKAVPKIESMANKLAKDVDVICSGVTTHEALTNLLSNLCTNVDGNSFVTFNDLESSFNESYDHVIFDSSFEECPLLKCIYDKLNDQNNTLFCNTVGNFQGNDKFHIEFKATSDDFDKAQYYPDLGRSVVNLKSTYCQENNPYNLLEIAGSFLHESIHGELHRIALEAGLDPNAQSSYTEIWDSYILDYYEKNKATLNDIHHAIIVRVDKYVQQIAEALWELNGKHLTVDHYMHIAWEGLRDYSIDYANDEYGLNSPYYQLHQELEGTSLNFSCP